MRRVDGERGEYGIHAILEDAGELSEEEAMAMNFRTGRAGLPEIFAGIDANEGHGDTPAIYLSSIDVKDYFDGLHEANHVDLGTALRQGQPEDHTGIVSRVEHDQGAALQLRDHGDAVPRADLQRGRPPAAEHTAPGGGEPQRA